MARTTSRPLSPHLTIWKWGPAMAVSIIHRVTGNGLAGGKRFQTDYFADTGRTLPLLQLRPMPTDGRLFIYDPNDQALR